MAVFIEKNLHIGGPLQFKLMPLKGQLYSLSAWYMAGTVSARCCTNKTVLVNVVCVTLVKGLGRVADPR